MDATLNGQVATRKRRSRDVDIRVQEQVEVLGTKYGAAQILRHLTAEHPDWPMPEIRTVQRMVKDARLPTVKEAGQLHGADTSGGSWEPQLRPWRVQDAKTPEEVAAVLPVLAAKIAETEGERDYLTNLEASWVSRITAAAPDLSPAWVGWLATKCAIREIRAGPGRDATSPYDKLLAMAPWRSDEAFLGFARFVRKAHSEWLPNADHGFDGVVLDACRLRADATGTPVIEVAEALAGRPFR
jgi:hypothetical protein